MVYLIKYTYGFILLAGFPDDSLVESGPSSVDKLAFKYMVRKFKDAVVCTFFIF